MSKYTSSSLSFGYTENLIKFVSKYWATTDPRVEPIGKVVYELAR